MCVPVLTGPSSIYITYSAGAPVCRMLEAEIVLVRHFSTVICLVVTRTLSSGGRKSHACLSTGRRSPAVAGRFSCPLRRPLIFQSRAAPPRGAAPELPAPSSLLSAGLRSAGSCCVTALPSGLPFVDKTVTQTCSFVRHSGPTTDHHSVRTSKLFLSSGRTHLIFL